ncbi:hypothetical protein EB796_016271 [Bugula neritina]|uniref:Uncharacterized protein n=1 Tax=Bugula neritina TaxID=10212 RepID=A0A7J7JIH3_BUGNE|nr:hypothetical protein EB796_016271 [Bugula neritina]
MCRWGCQTTDTTYMCKWCGTRFCKECLRGEFGTGIMRDSSWCFQCNQKKCVGKRVEYVPSANSEGKSNKASRGSNRKTGKTKKPSNKGDAKKKKGKRKK